MELSAYGSRYQKHLELSIYDPSEGRGCSFIVDLTPKQSKKLREDLKAAEKEGVSEMLGGDLVPIRRPGEIWSIGLLMSEALIRDIKNGEFDEDRAIILEPWEAKAFRKALKAVERRVESE